MVEGVYWGVGLALLGAIFGSFIGALVVRWPDGRSVLAGRSQCDGCGRTLTPGELVPLISGLALGGKCRTCRAPIDRVQLVAEAGALGVGLASGALLPGPAGAASALFGWLLLALALLDLRAWWLPDALTVSLALAGLAVGVAGIGPMPVDRIIGGVAGYAALQGIRLGYRALRKREGLGGGDPKLFGAIGLWVGWQLLPAVALLACLIGFGVVAFWLLTGRRARGDDRLPFGALLAAAAYPAWVAMLWTAA